MPLLASSSSSVYRRAPDPVPAVSADQLNRLFAAPTISPLQHLSQKLFRSGSLAFKGKVALGLLVAWIWLYTLVYNVTAPVDVSAIQGSGLEGRLDGLYGLVRRRAPKQDVDRIRFELMASSDDEEERFEWVVAKGGSEVLLRGTTLSSLSKGLGDFYRQYCGVELVSWADWSRPSRGCLGFDIEAEAGSLLRRERPDDETSSSSSKARFPLRYGWNAVTFSYTTTWWTFERYERELDWLALRGVNLLLAHEGQEYIMRKMFLEDQIVKTQDVDGFFVHQTYLAWNRMGNIHKVGSPPDWEYIDGRFRLQLRLLKRMKELGISPVLPGFNGFVPQGTPGSKCYLKYWSGFSAEASSVCRLDPQSPLFAHFAARMVEIQLDLYKDVLSSSSSNNKVVYFSSDTYNENPVQEKEDFAALAKAIYNPPAGAAKRAGFHSLKLVMQMWFLANDWQYWTRETAMRLLESFPRKSLVLLDLHAEKRAQFERLDLDEKWFRKTRHSLVFCVLHNFGGGGGIAGEVVSTFRRLENNDRVARVLKASGGGLGFAPEALEQNELVYDMALQSAWRQRTNQSLNGTILPQWIRSRYRRSLALLPESIVSAWQRVLGTAYSRPDHLAGFGPTKSVWEIRPFPQMVIRGRFQPTAYAYPVGTFLDPVRNLLEESLKDDRASSSAMVYDLIDFARQLASDTGLSIVRALERSSFNNDEDEFDSASTRMKALLRIVGDLLSSHPGFCFTDNNEYYPGSDVTRAKRYRRQLITVWHEDNDGSLADYGSRQWGGSLFWEVHLKRWELVLDSWDSVSSIALEKKFKDIELEWAGKVDDDDVKCAKEVNLKEIASVVQRLVDFVMDKPQRILSSA